MDGEEKPELEEEVGDDPESAGIPRGCMLAIWWLTMIVFLVFVVKFALGRFGILK